MLEIECLRSALGQHRLVTITGMGGTGKSRLALELATVAGSSYADGTAYAELEPLRTREELVAAIATATVPHAEPHRGADPFATLVAGLRAREILVVVDNCEHVLADVGAVIDDLLDACPTLTVVATSREPLRLDGEWVAPVEPFTVEPCSLAEPSDAVQLFVERAARAQNGFLLDEKNLDDVVAICRHVDGIALAIELAAGRVAHLTTGEIARRLREQPGSLGSREVAADRHRTLTATLDWSLALLTDEERTTFCRLAVFPGGADLEAIEAVCAPADVRGDAVLEIVSGLVDKSLILVDERGNRSRYRMLGTVRHYALELLRSSGEEVETRRRHAHWVLDQAGRRINRARDATQPANAAEQVGDVLAALTWTIGVGEVDLAVSLAAATWQCWEITGRHTDGRRLLEEALELPGDVKTADRARVRIATAGLAFAAGEYTESRRRYEEAIAEIEDLGLAAEASDALNSLAMVVLFEGDSDQARRLATHALEQSEQIDGNDAGRAFVHSSLGLIESYAKQPAIAERHFLEALRTFRWLGLKREAAGVLNNLGHLAADAADPGRAHRFYEGALQLQREIGDDRGSALSLNNLALAAQQRGNLDRAWELAEAARELFRRVGDRPGEAATLNNLANLAAEREQPRQAMDLYAECINAFREVGDARRLATSLENLADLAEGLGEMQLTWDSLLDAVSLRNQLHQVKDVGEGIDRLIRIAGEWRLSGVDELRAAAARDDRDAVAISHALEAARWIALPTPKAGRRPSVGELTNRETQVVGLVGRGFSNAEIASELFISERTVESHVSSARMKLAIDSRTKLTRWAIEHGLVG